MDGEVDRILPARPYERWFDLCFRLIILALAGFWLLMPPAASDDRAAEVKAAIATR